jgi:oligopeptide/dipeptide ABC transporter ATP-binding protein
MTQGLKGQPLLSISGLSVHFPSKRGAVQAVDQVNLAVQTGEILGVVGESGCGKSTLLLAILGLLGQNARLEGEVWFEGQDLRRLTGQQLRKVRGKEIAMIFQDPLATLNPAFPIGEQIREALRLHAQGRNGWRWPFDFVQRRRERNRVLEVMEEVEISAPQDRYAAYPHQFSGGMQQRALIAIALACGPRLLLADEPTTALDVTIQAQILALMRRLNQEHGMAIVLVTHDLGVAAEFCDRIAVMYAGRVVEEGSADAVVEQPQHPYTSGLLRCRPQIGERTQQLEPIPGDVPDLAMLPQGCAFAGRCPLVRPVCETGPIPLVETSPGHSTRCLAPLDFQREPGWQWDDRVRPADGQIQERSHAYAY